MRGAPLLQTLLLFLTLLGLGISGYLFLHRDLGSDRSDHRGGSKQAVTTASHVPTVDAEIEILFSTPPISYRLTRPNLADPKNPVLVMSSSEKEEIENPSYSDVQIPVNQLSSYWLDVTWKNDPEENSLHFVKITLSPSLGPAQSFTFSCDSREMNETFDYTPQEHSHDE